MNEEFFSIAQEHARRWPAMEAQDFGKLAYQSEFGPAHMLQSPDRVLAALMDECEQAGGAAPPPEPIGNGLCRFHLTAAHGSLQTAPLLARLFAVTAAMHRGTGSREGLLEKLDSLNGLNIPGWEDWAADYTARDCPVLSHSDAYRAAYRPHYRLLRSGFAGFFPALLVLDELARAKKPTIAAIDGRCGSGKTRLASIAEHIFPCQVVHMDDFYLPPDRRAPNWENIPAGNMDLERFREEVLLPAQTGTLKRYRPFDCQTGQFGAPVELDGWPLTLVEGSYSHHPALAEGYSRKIFLTCSHAEQIRRLKTREGDDYPMFEQRWTPMEERYFGAFQIEENAGLVLDTTEFFR